MFKGLGQLASLMTQLPKIKAEMEQIQHRLAQLVVEGDAGGGMVKVRASGRMEILGVTLSEEAFRLNDREMIEDLIRAATNQALERARQQSAAEMGKMATAFGLPEGMQLPGLN